MLQGGESSQSTPPRYPACCADLLAPGVRTQSQRVIVSGQGGGGARVPRLGTGAQRGGEVQPEVDRVTNLATQNKN